MGETVRSFLTLFSTSMTNEAQYLSDLDTKVAQAVSDFTGTEEDARAAQAETSDEPGGSEGAPSYGAQSEI